MDYNLQDHELNMTIFYSKRTGAIQTYATGLQDMSIYGVNAEDMKIIYDFIQTTKNDDFINNFQNYKVDINTKQIVKIITTEEEKKMQEMQNLIIQQSKAIAEMSALVAKVGVK